MQGFQVINGEHKGTILISEDSNTLSVFMSDQLGTGTMFGTDYLAVNQFKTVPITGSNTHIVRNLVEVLESMKNPDKFPMLTLKLG